MANIPLYACISFTGMEIVLCNFSFSISSSSILVNSPLTLALSVFRPTKQFTHESVCDGAHSYIFQQLQLCLIDRPSLFSLVRFL